MLFIKTENYFFNGIFPLKKTQGTRIKTLTPKQMFYKLPIEHPQVKYRQIQRGACSLPIFSNYLGFFCNHFEEIQTVLFEVELIISNTPLTYLYPNTIKTCITSNQLLFGRQLLYYSSTTSPVVRNLQALA